MTRFHHAGDSDAEEEVGGDRGVAGSSREVIIDESDENENERMVDKRRYSHYIAIILDMFFESFEKLNKFPSKAQNV